MSERKTYSRWSSYFGPATVSQNKTASDDIRTSHAAPVLCWHQHGNGPLKSHHTACSCSLNSFVEKVKEKKKGSGAD